MQRRGDASLVGAASASGQSSPVARLSLLMKGSSAMRGSGSSGGDIGGGAGGGRGGATSAGSSSIDDGGGCSGDGGTLTAGGHCFSETIVAAGDEGCEGTGPVAPLPHSPLYLAEERGGRASPSSLLPPTGSMPQSPECRAEEGTSGRGSSRGGASAAGPFPPATSSWPNSPILPQHHPAQRPPTAGAEMDGSLRSTRVTAATPESSFFESAALCRPESPRGPGAFGLVGMRLPRPASSQFEHPPLPNETIQQPNAPTIGDAARSHSFLPHIPQPPPQPPQQQPAERLVNGSARSAVVTGAAAASRPMQEAMKAQVDTFGWGEVYCLCCVLH